MDRKVALVVGGSGGIGFEIVTALAKSNIDVCCSYCHKRERAESIAHELGARKVEFYKMDLFDDISVQNATQQIFQDYKRVDIVVFCVSLPLENKRLIKMEWKDFHEHFTIQVKGLFTIFENLKAQIKAKHKTKFIIILSEVCFGKPPAGFSAYVTAKYALMGFCKAMVADLAGYNCTVNMISPGMVQTPLISSFPQKLIEITSEANPLKRIATPSDVANVVLFLASDASDYLNGVNIMVNGGGIIQ
jgi:3-oxoacyl-[acyl-carrier protein] reductase